MALFQSFKDTIFIKKSSDSITKLKEINDHFDCIEEKDRLKQDVAYTNLNIKIEKQIEYILQGANIGMFVLQDLHLHYQDMVQHIDYAIVTPAHCYLVACKDMVGNLTVNERGEFFVDYQLEDQNYSTKIYSPYQLVLRHKDVLKKKWQSNSNLIQSALGANDFEEYYQPLIVYGYPDGMIDASNAPYSIKKIFTTSSRLIQYIQRDIENTDFLKLDGERKMKERADLLLNFHNDTPLDHLKDYTIKQEEKVMVDKKDLYERLCKYRDIKAKKTNSDIYTILNDLQISQLVELQPANIIELQGAYILEPFKLDLHGNEIIQIINGASIKDDIQDEQEKEDELLTPEQELYVENFTKQIDLKNDKITTNYGMASINKTSQVILNCANVLQSQKNTFQNHLKDLEVLENNTKVMMIELYMYLKAGKKAIENSKATEFHTLSLNLENHPGLANELAYNNYVASLEKMEKQVKELEMKYLQVKKIHEVVCELKEKQTNLINLIEAL